MIVLTLAYIQANTKIDELAAFAVGTVAEQEKVTRAGNYIENKIFLDVEKDLFTEDEGVTYDFPDDFQFLTLNILECYWLTKDMIVDINTTKATSVKIDDASKTKTRKDVKDLYSRRGIPCDEDTIASIM